LLRPDAGERREWNLSAARACALADLLRRLLDCHKLSVRGLIVPAQWLIDCDFSAVVGVHGVDN